MVITGRTRNALIPTGIRGFESHHLRHEMPVNTAFAGIFIFGKTVPLKILSLHGFGIQASFSSSFKSSEAPSLLASQGLEKSESGSSKCRSSFHILEEILVLTETDCL